MRVFYSDLRVADTAFLRNIVSGGERSRGGALAISNTVQGTAQILSTTFDDNRAVDGMAYTLGGAIAMSPEASLELRSVRLLRNQVLRGAQQTGGGAIWLDSASQLVVVETVLEGNVAQGRNPCGGCKLFDAEGGGRHAIQRRFGHCRSLGRRDLDSFLICAGCERCDSVYWQRGACAFRPFCAASLRRPSLLVRCRRMGRVRVEVRFTSRRQGQRPCWVPFSAPTKSWYVNSARELTLLRALCTHLCRS